MTKKTAWVIFASRSAIAVSVIDELKQEKDTAIILIARNQEYKKDGNVHFLNTSSYLEKMIAFSDYELNVLLFNGKIFYKKFDETTKDDLDEIIESNFSSSALFLIELFKKQFNLKRVFYIGSRAGYVTGLKYFSLYSGTKIAMLGLFRSLSSEFPDCLFTYYIVPSVKSDLFEKGISSKELLDAKPTPQKVLEPKQVAEEIISFIDNQKENVPDLVLKSKYLY